MSAEKQTSSHRIVVSLLQNQCLTLFHHMPCNIFYYPKKSIVVLIKYNMISFGAPYPKKKVHYVNWDTLTLLKVQGSLGLHKAYDKNITLPTNLSWRIFSQHNCQWAQTLINKHSLKNCPSTHSFIWENVLKGGKFVVMQLLGLLYRGIT